MCSSPPPITPLPSVSGGPWSGCAGGRSSSTPSAPARGETRKLELSHICFVEVLGHTLIYHTTEGEVTASGSMSEVERELTGRFFRCNKSYLVNLEHVDSIRGDLVTVEGQQLPVSRARKKPFLDALNNYINEVSK